MSGYRQQIWTVVLGGLLLGRNEANILRQYQRIPYLLEEGKDSYISSHQIGSTRCIDFPNAFRISNCKNLSEIVSLASYLCHLRTTITYSALLRSTPEVFASELCSYRDGGSCVLAVALPVCLAVLNHELVFVQEVHEANHSEHTAAVLCAERILREEMLRW